MPDWCAIVRRQLAALQVPAPIEAALADEHAEHLRLSYDERVAAGETPERSSMGGADARLQDGEPAVAT